MATKRKRKAPHGGASIDKKQKVPASDTPVKRDLLERYYGAATTLREHILCKLPGTSRLRRNKIAALRQSESASEAEVQLAHLLDKSLVCGEASPADDGDLRWEQFLSFSQRGDESYVSISDGVEGSIYSQEEIVDFAVWLLFSRHQKTGSRPKHLLCDGFRRNSGPGEQTESVIPGLFALYPNSQVQALKEAPWPQLLALLGQSGERIMLDLIIDCSIYMPAISGYQNYYQITGVPLAELDLSRCTPAFRSAKDNVNRSPSDINLVRSRIFYANPSLTAKGLAQPGLKRHHILNRSQRERKAKSTEVNSNGGETSAEQRRINVRIMMYMFPRQFGLHNVFTSAVDTSQTAQKFQDYSMREEEIALRYPEKPGDPQCRPPKIPKRLRGDVSGLIEKLQTLHRRCSYTELLRHYCPCLYDELKRPSKTKSRKDGTRIMTRLSGTAAAASQTPKGQERHGINHQQETQALFISECKSLVELATPVSQVSAFCQAVIRRIVPKGFWGEGEIQPQNEILIMKRIDEFIKLRRFELMSLHEIAHGLRLNEMTWLKPPQAGNEKPSKTDTAKRREILNEFLYYIFDSLLIPLIRNNFYVTESNTHRYQVFYFRHEVWKHIAEPSMAALKTTMFEEVKLDDAIRIMQSRRLGFSQIRLLPKGQKLRPIMNLRRRGVSVGGPSKVLGPSINAILGPIHAQLKLETALHPAKLGSTLFSVSDIYTRLRRFQENLGPKPGFLYFAKVDVQGAFDTIPQDAVIKLMHSIPTQEQYTILKHAELKPGERAMVENEKSASKPIRRWHSTALGKGHSAAFTKRLEAGLAGSKRNTVFVNSAVQRSHHVHELLHLLTQHVSNNIVKVGKRYYRQKTGIPQGSVLSSFLCNYFYADLEAQHLGFLVGPDCLLLRLIDDFLLISLDRSKAAKFVDLMHQGFPDYGVVVNPSKTLVNFDIEHNGTQVRKNGQTTQFPYCGIYIDCQTLEITKDRERDAGTNVSFSLTVDHGRAQGQNFQRKILNAFKIQSHLMFYDTAHNRTQTVLKSLYGAFGETARKMLAYMRSLSKPHRPSQALVIRTIAKVIDVAYLLLTGKSRKMRYPQYVCAVRKTQVALIGYCAFAKTLDSKQAGYREVIAWLDVEKAKPGADRQRIAHQMTEG